MPEEKKNGGTNSLRIWVKNKGREMTLLEWTGILWKTVAVWTGKELIDLSI